LFRTLALSALLILGLAPLAWSKDAIKSAVTPVGSPAPIMQQNGNPYSSGTFAVGTIQLFYTVNAYQFTTGPFASFQLNLTDAHFNTNPATTYPVTLNLTQTGSANLTLTPVPNSFSVTGVGWASSSTVLISIPASVPTDPNLNLDGTDLVGNLQLATSPQGSHLDTVTTIQVHIKLVHPTSCLRVYDFITDEAFTTTVTYTDVNVNNHTGKVTSTNPFGQLSDDILIVNTCGTNMSFDLKILLDSSFETNPHGNPGNAVFTFMTSGNVDPAAFNIADFGTGTPEHQDLCLTSITVPAGATFLATVHMGVIKGNLASSLPASGSFEFSSEVRTAGSSCTGVLNPLATPDPAWAPLAFSTK
jgi:hypothetical protein